MSNLHLTYLADAGRDEQKLLFKICIGNWLIWIFVFMISLLQSVLVSSVKAWRRWKDSLADVFSCREPDATGSLRRCKWDRTAAMFPSVPALFPIAVGFCSTGVYCTADARICDSASLVILLSDSPCYNSVMSLPALVSLIPVMAKQPDTAAVTTL